MNQYVSITFCLSVVLLLFFIPTVIATQATFGLNLSLAKEVAWNHSGVVFYNCSLNQSSNETYNLTFNFNYSNPVRFNLSLTKELIGSDSLYHYNDSNLSFSLYLPTNLNRSYDIGFNNLTNQDQSLDINFNSSFVKPELLIINSSPAIFQVASFYVLDNQTLRIPFYLNFSGLNLSLNNTIRGIPIVLDLWFPKLNKSLNKTIWFKDVNPPLVSDYEFFDTMKVGNLERVRVFYRDYSPLSNVNCTSSLPALMNQVIKPDYVDFLITPELYGPITLNFSLTDSFNNTVVFSRDYSVNPLGTLNLPNINLLKLKRNLLYVKTLYAGTMVLPFNVSIRSLKFNLTSVETNNTDKYYSIAVSDGTRDYELYENTTAHLNTNRLILKVKGMAFGTLHTVLEVKYPKIIKGNNLFSFNTTFADYSLFQSQNYSVGATTTLCQLDEKPDFEQSKIQCCVDLPYNTNVEESLLLIPRRDFKWHEQLQQQRLDEWSQRFHSQVMWKYIFLACLILIILIILFHIFTPEYFYRY